MIERAKADLTDIYFEDIESLVLNGTWTINKTVRFISERMAAFALQEIEAFCNEVDTKAQELMLQDNQVSGKHYAAMRLKLAERGITWGR